MRIEKCCVLCGKQRPEVKRLILGVHGGVCAECVYRCMTVLQSDGEPTPTPEQPAAAPAL